MERTAMRQEEDSLGVVEVLGKAEGPQAGGDTMTTTEILSVAQNDDRERVRWG
jgi:hypothetical protein